MWVTLKLDPSKSSQGDPVFMRVGHVGHVGHVFSVAPIARETRRETVFLTHLVTLYKIPIP